MYSTHPKSSTFARNVEFMRTIIDIINNFDRETSHAVILFRNAGPVFLILDLLNCVQSYDFVDRDTHISFHGALCVLVCATQTATLQVFL